MFLKSASIAFILLSAQTAFSQARINEIDAMIIQTKATRLVEKNLKDLYNLVAGTEMEASEFDVILKHTISESDPLFDPAARIDDDTDPAKKQDGQAARDEVGTYLKKLNLFYVPATDADANSIELITQKISKVKVFEKKLYVKVYFLSNFKGKSKTTKSPFTVNNRVAEVAVSQKDSNWIAKIVRIDFFNPSDTANDFENDVILERDPAFKGIDSIEAAKRIKSQEQMAKQKEQERLIALTEFKDKQYDKLIKEGDDALALMDYTTAIKKYYDANDVKPYEKYPFERISNARMEKQKSERSSSLLYDGYVEKAKRAASRRDRVTALDNYRLARQTDPERAKSFESDLRALDILNESLAKMEELYKAGRYKDAIAEYSKIIKQNKNTSSKDFSDYYNGRGKCYYQTSELDKALKDFTTAIELDRENEDAFINRSFVYKSKADYVNAITDRRQAIGIDKENPANYIELASLRILNSFPVKDAIQELDNGLKQETLQKIPALYLKRGQLLADERQWKKAYDDFTTVVTIDPGNASGFYSRGLVNLQLNKSDSAASDFESARRNDLDSGRISAIAGIASGYMSKAKRTSVYDSAMIYVSNAIAVNPYSDQYRFEKAEFLFSKSEYVPAITYYSQALEINKSHTEALYKRGIAYHLTGDHQKAVADLKQAAALSPGDYRIIKSFADAESALGGFSNAALRYEEALKLMDKQKGIDNIFAETYDSLGKAYYELKNYEASVTALRGALRKNESFADAYFNRGRSYFMQGKQEEAKADLSKAVSLNSGIAEWHYYAGKSYKASGKFSEAAVYFNSVIKLDASNKYPDALYERGKANLLLENYDTALKDYLEILSRKTDTAYSSYNTELGNIYINTKHPEEAFLYYKKQYTIDSSNTDNVYAIGTALVQRGLIDDAIPYLERVLQTKTVTPKKMRNNKLLAMISEDKRFKDLLKKY